MTQIDPPPVRYVGTETANTCFHHGELHPVVGVSHYQVLRSNRSHPKLADDCGWTYNHAPNLAYWQDRFYLSYLSNPVSEHVPPGQTLLTTSDDGIHWAKPQLLFPTYRVPDGIYHSPAGVPPLARQSDAVMHQRMGFYTAPDGRLLALGFYGISAAHNDNPNDGTGIGRVVREIYADGRLGPIFFIRYNRHAGWNEENTRFPFYQASDDAGFVQACNALLADKLATLQWWEEDRSHDGFYAAAGGKALSYYHLADQRVVGLWKWSQVAISNDEGATWSPMQKAPSLVMAGAKIWGQRTSDGRYALIYNPTPDNIHRWPLAVVTSDDGLNFDNLALVNGEAPPRRYFGIYKDFGQNYVRGIAESNGRPPDGAVWIAYSMNKEDIWVSRIPVPIRTQVETSVYDTFDDVEIGGLVPDWNIYSPSWAQVGVAENPDGSGRSLQLHDREPSDYARAERIFPASTHPTISLQVAADEQNEGELHVEITDRRARLATALIFTPDGALRVRNGGAGEKVGMHRPERWHTLRFVIDVRRHRFALFLDERALLADGYLAQPLHNVERLILRTGPRRQSPTLDSDRFAAEDLPGVRPKEPPFDLSHPRGAHR